MFWIEKLVNNFWANDMLVKQKNCTQVFLKKKISDPKTIYRRKCWFKDKFGTKIVGKKNCQKFFIKNNFCKIKLVKNKLGLSCTKLSLASAKLHTSLSAEQLKLATN